MNIRAPLKNSISFKMVVIGILLLVFFLLSSLVLGLIEERSDRQAESIMEVSSKWGQGQTIVGPVLTVPYLTYADNTKYAYFLPETLSITGDVQSEIKSRGIYDVPLYEGALKLEGKFGQPSFNGLVGSYKSILWEQSSIAIGITDLRGITEQLSVSWNGEKRSLSSGVQSGLFDAGVSTVVAVDSVNPRSYDFSFDLNLKGSQNLYFVPAGKDTSVKLTSDWNSPSFDGVFLPVEHEITQDGFTASWHVIDLNRSFPQKWISDSNYLFESSESALGVEFYLPVDVYQKTERSAKYAMAVITLVFVVLFLVEVIGKRRIHPMQYILIGLALTIFYTLLLSLAEYVRFGYAYIISSIAIIGMVGLFSKSVMKSSFLGLMSGVIVAFLYGLVYVLLQMQDFTLLVGSIMIFVILGVVMYLTRKINWYGEEGAN